MPQNTGLSKMKLIFFALLLTFGLTRAAPFAPTAPEPDRAMRDFLQAYWDESRQYFLAWNKDAPFARPGASGPAGGKYSDFWWAAQLWDLVLDAAIRNPEFLPYVDKVFNGFAKEYPDWTNDFNDDLGWWAQASLRAYGLTKNPRYLERAKLLFKEIYGYWTDLYGGGVIWRRSGTVQKNVATNAPLAIIAVRLFQATEETNYLEAAKRLYAWVDEKLTDGDSRVFDNLENGELRRWDFTYNVGNFVLAALALREVTPEQAEKLLTRATKSMDWMLTNLTNAGILLDEGTGDGGGFKGVAMRALRRLADTPELPERERERYRQALRDNATQVWNSRRQDGLVGSNWAMPQERGVIESLAAASAVSALQLAPTPLEARIVLGNRRYEAENTTREGVNPSITVSGYSGRGYINGFFRQGQWLEFFINVPETKTYTLRWRYSAGGGTARRSVVVGERQTSKLEFAATADWRTWAEVSAPLALQIGANWVRLRFDDSSRNYLNLDKLEVQP
jgi:predicted alpha-1,6-mannanase (GH76 family)